jgi:hypothetical protein
MVAATAVVAIENHVEAVVVVDAAAAVAGVDAASLELLI